MLVLLNCRREVGARVCRPGRAIILLLALVGSVPLAGTASAADERDAHFISVQIENDSIENNSDEQYTHGMEVSWLRGEEPPPAWLSTFADWVPLYRKGSDLNFASYSIGQKIFTPYDTRATTLQPNDRPYAAYLYGSAAIMSRIDHNEYLDSGNMLELTVGVVGPSALGEETNNTVHRLLGYSQSEGWEHQLSDEPVVGLSYSYLWRMVRPATDSLEYGINPHISVALGNAYTYGAAGLMVRFGDNLRRDLNPPNINPGFPGVSYYQSLDGVDWYVFGGHEMRWVERDIFLDGNTFVDSHSVEKEPVVGDTQYGVVFLYHDLRFSYSTTIRSREFKSQQRDTIYRAINLSFRH